MPHMKRYPDRMPYFYAENNTAYRRTQKIWGKRIKEKRIKEKRK
jgi:hypothetical protein